MTAAPIEDPLVDALVITFVASPPKSLQLVGSRPELSPIDNLVGRLRWGDLLFFAQGVLGRSGRSVNDVGFAFPEELDEAAERLEGSVQLFDSSGKIYLREPAFERLMLRFFEAVCPPGAGQVFFEGEPWWPELLRHVALLRTRVGARSVAADIVAD